MSKEKNKIINDLPEGWDVLTYDDIQENNLIGIVRNTNEQNSSLPYKYVKMNNILINGKLDLSNYTCVNATVEEFEKYKLRRGDFLFNTRNSVELVGKTCVFDLDDNNVLFNNNILRTRFKKNTSSHFIAYQFQTTFIKDQLESIKSGTTNVAAIYYKSLAKLKLLIPNIQTQKKILQQLDALFQRIDKAIQLSKENLEHCRHLLPAALNEVFGEAEEKGWKYCRVFEILTLEKKTITPELEKEYNIIGLENIERDSGKLVDFTPLLGKQSISNKVVFKKGMILYGKLRPYLNKVWVAEFDGIATTEILPFKVDLKKANPLYIAYYFRSGEFLNKVNENCSGARMPRLTTKFWDDATIPIPDLPTQQNIVTYLNQLGSKQQQLQQHYTKQLQQLQQLKASLLDGAFKGEL